MNESACLIRKKKKLNGVGKSRKASTSETTLRPATPTTDEPQEEEEAQVEKRVLDAVMLSYRAARALYNQMVDTDGQVPHSRIIPREFHNLTRVCRPHGRSRLPVATRNVRL